MANEIITTLHPDQDPNTNLYPNIKRENVPNKSIDTYKLDDNVLSLIGSLKPSGVDTSTNILAFTTNKGIYVASNNGHWYYWDGSQYVDGGVYQATEIPNGATFKKYSQDQYNDLNNLPVNAIMTITLTTILNKPYNNAKGTILSFNQYSNEIGGNGTSQLFITDDNNIWYRIKWSDIWLNWKSVQIADNSITGSKIVNGETFKKFSQDLYTDLNSLPNNSIITFTQPKENLPYTNAKGTLLSYNQYSNDNGGNGTAQLFIDVTANQYIRIKWGGNWTNWNKLNLQTTEINKYNDYGYKITLDNTKSCLFVGDSITKGYIGKDGNNNEILMDDPYPKLLSQKYGNTYWNEAVSGSMFGHYGTTDRIITQLENTTHKNVDYLFIGGGTNDWGWQVDLSSFKTDFENTLQYALNNFPNAQIIIINPINPNMPEKEIQMQLYRNIITEVSISNDNSNKIHIVQGYNFDFPNYNDNISFRNNVYVDGLHPNQFGIKTCYLKGLIKSIIEG